jgi:hypothetical protein
MGSKVGWVVRTLPSQQYAPGLNPRYGDICELNCGNDGLDSMFFCGYALVTVVYMGSFIFTITYGRICYCW